MFIIDVDGRRIQVAANYILKSGEALALSPLFMDHATREQRRAVGLTDASIIDAYGIPGGHTRGYVFAVDTAIRQRAVDAYDERSRWMEDAWRHRHEQDDERKGSTCGASAYGTTDEKPPPPRSLADAQAAAERAYLDKIERLKNAWKNRDAA
jgi:hypothetical protein